jgi:hypothetical protein
MDYSREIVKWRGLEIEVLHNADWSPIYREVYGYALAHLQICSLNRKPIPISETGYQSKFERAENIAAEGGAAAYVVALDHAELAQCGNTGQVDTRQLSLF